MKIYFNPGLSATLMDLYIIKHFYVRGWFLETSVTESFVAAICSSLQRSLVVQRVLNERDLTGGSINSTRSHLI